MAPMRTRYIARRAFLGPYTSATRPNRGRPPLLKTARIWTAAVAVTPVAATRSIAMGFAFPMIMKPPAVPRT